MIVINEEFIDPEYFTEGKITRNIGQFIADKILRYVTPGFNKLSAEQRSAFKKCIKDAQVEINEAIDKKIPESTTFVRAHHYKSVLNTFKFAGYSLYQSKKVYVGNRMFYFRSSSDVKAVKVVFDSYSDIVFKILEKTFNKECKELFKDEPGKCKYELGVITYEYDGSPKDRNQRYKVAIPYIYKKVYKV